MKTWFNDDNQIVLIIVHFYHFQARVGKIFYNADTHEEVHKEIVLNWTDEKTAAMRYGQEIAEYASKGYRPMPDQETL